MYILGFTPSVCSAPKIFLAWRFVSVQQTLSCLCVPYSILHSSRSLPCFVDFFNDFSLPAWPFHCVGLILIKKNMKIETLAEQMNTIEIPVIVAVYQG
jgi:hypothetical protein